MKDKEAEYHREYTTKHLPLYQSLAPRMWDLLGSLLSDAHIPVVQIEHRTKSVESFMGKLVRKSYSDPFQGIKDFAGIRVITYYEDDVAKVAQILRNEFKVDNDHSTDKLEDLDVDEFGYRSFHLVCSTKAPRSKLAEWRQYSGLSFEVQIRSALQHAWAAISHKLDYKSAKQAPKEVRRQLYRLSALLELGDEQFTSIRDRTRDLTDGYRDDVDKGQLDIPLNLSSLKEYMNELVDRHEWLKMGLAAGMEEQDEGGDFELDTILLFETLIEMDIRTIRELDDLITKNKKKSHELLSNFSNACDTKDYKFDPSPEDVLHIFVTLAALERLPKNFVWGDPWVEEMQDIMNDFIREGKLA